MGKTSHPSPCTPRKWCTAMQLQIHSEPNARRAGLVRFNLGTIDPKTGRITEWCGGVVMKRAASDKGVFLNVCPWCEADLRWQGKPSTEEFAKARRERRVAVGVALKDEELRPVKASKAVRRG